MTAHATTTGILIFGDNNRSQLRRALTRRYPGLDAARVDDAIQDAFMQVLEGRATPDHRIVDGEGLLNAAQAFAFLRTVALRSLRGTWRRKWHRSEVGCAALQELAATPPSAMARVEVGEVRGRLSQLLPEAATLYGGTQASALLQALHDVFVWFADDNNTGIARRHGIPREYLSRAVSWVRRALKGE